MYDALRFTFRFDFSVRWKTHSYIVVVSSLISFLARCLILSPTYSAITFLTNWIHILRKHALQIYSSFFIATFFSIFFHVFFFNITFHWDEYLHYYLFCWVLFIWSKFKTKWRPTLQPIIFSSRAPFHCHMHNCIFFFCQIQCLPF